jgi:O-methyltransferase
MGRMKPTRPTVAPSLEAVTAYLHLLKKTLLRFPLSEEDRAMRSQIAGIRAPDLVEIDRWINTSPLELGHECPDVEGRAAGRDWPASAETMIGLFRMDNLHALLLDVIQRGVPGDVAETGAWRGGATIFMRAVLRACRDVDRRVWVADSFEGLPPPDPGRFPADAGDTHWQHPELSVSLPEVKANFERYGMLDRQVRFLPGWFRDTLPDAPIDELALLRIDGDMYESTMVALRSLYPKVSRGGYVIVDDYGALQSCREAVEDFRRDRSVSEPLLPIDWTGVMWQVSGS